MSILPNKGTWKTDLFLGGYSSHGNIIESLENAHHNKIITRSKLLNLLEHFSQEAVQLVSVSNVSHIEEPLK
jgi:hypothetical protein